MDETYEEVENEGVPFLEITMPRKDKVTTMTKQYIEERVAYFQNLLNQFT
tara:strand:+ start:43 stop:192 length:150 start_codon:yes stop_codon:yes gene_type:complete